jgi:hypothetical protein
LLTAPVIPVVKQVRIVIGSSEEASVAASEAAAAAVVPVSAFVVSADAAGAAVVEDVWFPEHPARSDATTAVTVISANNFLFMNFPSPILV